MSGFSVRQKQIGTWHCCVLIVFSVLRVCDAPLLRRPVFVLRGRRCSSSLCARCTDAIKSMLALNQSEQAGQSAWKLLVFDDDARDVIAPLLNVGELREQVGCRCAAQAVGYCDINTVLNLLRVCACRCVGRHVAPCVALGSFAGARRSCRWVAVQRTNTYTHTQCSQSLQFTLYARHKRM